MVQRKSRTRSKEEEIIADSRVEEPPMKDKPVVRSGARNTRSGIQPPPPPATKTSIKTTIRKRPVKTEASKSDITAERVMQELARVAFADIREALKWHDELGNEERGGKKKSTSVTLKASDELSPDIAAAIAEVVQTPSGPKIKLYDKRAALIDLGKILGIFKQDEEQSLRKVISDKPMDEQEWSKHYVR